MPLRWLRDRPPGPARGCCVVLLLIGLLWYVMTGVAVWALLQLPADQSRPSRPAAPSRRS
jgi:hypothetical protein